MNRILGSLLLVLALIAPGAAQATNYFGKIWLVQPTSAPGLLRFLTVQGPNGVSLYASSDYRDIMLQAFFRKSTMSIGYTSKACPPPVPGTCNIVNFISIDSTYF